MSERFQYAMASVGQADLLQLARFLTGAVQECHRENLHPHHDPAVRLIGFQIAYASNGDSLHMDYEKVFEFCRLKALTGPNYEMLQKEIESAESPEVPKAS